MDLNLSPENEAFRQEVGDFVRANLPGDIRDKMKQGLLPDKEDVVRWITILNAKGWVAPAWPVEHGGTGWDTQQIYIFQEELVANHAPMESGFGTGLVAPVLIAFGSEEQKARYLPRILSFEDWWCQGYSEPNAGSDLAALSCRAIRDGDDYVVNGTKMWTTEAHWADMIFCLVRTSTEGKKQAGISFLLMDMTTPGIAIKPVITIEGAHEVNQVFFDDVRVPAANLVGKENEGWTYAKVLLSHERMMVAGVPRAKHLMARLKKIAAAEQSGGRPLIENSRFRERLADLEIDLMTLDYSTQRFVAAANAGDEPGTEVSFLKIRGSEMGQNILEMTMEAVAYYAMPYTPEADIWGSNEPPIGPDYAALAAPQYFNERKISIFSGSNEIQRNIMSKFMLGL
jgi:alkylation response protein AidB-like acyl-CoA dehydrogenase